MSDGNDAGWVPVEGIGEPAETLEMTDFDSMHEVTHPIRGPLIRRFKHPRTVAEVAAIMDVPVTRLYHHVNRLVDAGLLRVVATRQVAAVTERRYQVVARSYRLHHDAFATLDRHQLAKALGSVFDLARIGLERLVEAGGYVDVDDPVEHSTITLAELHLTDDERIDLLHRLNELFEDVGQRTADERPGTAPFTLFVAAYPEADAG